MKILLLGILLTISSQTLIAACIQTEIATYTYMTKEEIISSYCSNYSRGKSTEAHINYLLKNAETYTKNGLINESEKTLEEAQPFIAEYACLEHNMKNAFLVLRKDHGIANKEDIKCE